MESKELLDRTFIIDKRINLIEAELSALNEIKEKYPKHSLISKTKTDLEQILILSLDDLMEYKTKIFMLINKIPDNTVRCVFEYRYIAGMKFDDIADKLFYSRRQILRFYNQGHEYITNLLESQNFRM